LMGRGPDSKSLRKNNQLKQEEDRGKNGERSLHREVRKRSLHEDVGQSGRR